MRPLATAEGGTRRLLVAPANFASQGFFWARAAERNRDVVAVSLQHFSQTQPFIGPADVSLDYRVGRHSKLWAEKQLAVLARDFTHVLLEASIPVLGGMNGTDLRAEVATLTDAGLSVAVVSHGSEIRQPSIHRSLEERSPFGKADPQWVAALEQRAKQNIEALDELGVQEFVSTPDLLEFRPGATWLPLLTDVEKWRGIDPRPVQAERPVVLHVPSSNAALKGSEPIGREMRRLDQAGAITYVEASNVPYEHMPRLIEQADIVVNQVGIGSYGALALESMLAGRPVVTQVWDSVRDHILSETGHAVPIVEANADTVFDVVQDLAADPEARMDLARRSREFADAVHDSSRVAGLLAPFLS